jgi:hypothetical protein
MQTKYCAKCSKATTGVKIDKKVYLCWECFIDFFHTYKPVNVKEINDKHNKQVKEYLKK